MQHSATGSEFTLQRFTGFSNAIFSHTGALNILLGFHSIEDPWFITCVQVEAFDSHSAQAVFGMLWNVTMTPENPLDCLFKKNHK